MQKFLNYKTSLILSLLFASIVIFWIQFWIPTLYGADGYLHIRLAEIIKELGPIKDFHWARFSVFGERFADKDFLYHVLLIPFTFFPNIFFGAKISACFFAILFLFVFSMVLFKYSRRAFIPIVIIAVLLSTGFLHVLSRPRPMIFVITLTLLAIYFLIEKKLWGIFIVTLIYTLSHVSGPYMIIYALLTEIVRYISEKKFYLKSIGVVVLAILIGFIIHPNFPNNILIFYLNAIVVPIYAVKWGLELGAEFFPMSTREFLLSYPLVVVGVLLLLSLAIFSPFRTKFATKVIFAHSALFLFFSLLSRRYIIHGYPLILLLLASYISSHPFFSSWGEERVRGAIAPKHGAGVSDRGQERISVKWVIPLVSLLFILTGWITYKDILSEAISDKIVNTHYQNVAKWMSNNIPKGELIFHTNWSDSQYFIGLNPNNDYLVTLDPIYMYWWDPELYKLYRDISFGRISAPYYFLKNTFKIKYGYAGKNYFGGLISQLRADTRFSILAEDNLGLIFRIN